MNWDKIMFARGNFSLWIILEKTSFLEFVNNNNCDNCVVPVYKQKNEEKPAFYNILAEKDNHPVIKVG